MRMEYQSTWKIRDMKVMRNEGSAQKAIHPHLSKVFLIIYVCLLLYGNGSCAGRSLLDFFAGRMMFSYVVLRAQTGISENLNC